MNILIKLMSIVSLVIAPYIAVQSAHGTVSAGDSAPGIVLASGNYAFENSNNLLWTGKKPTGQHIGTIQLASGSLTIDSAGNAKGSFEIDMRTIVNTDVTDSTWNRKFVDHLKDTAFFAVNQYPTSKLDIISITPITKNNYMVKANLTVKGITNEINFPATITIDGANIGVVADFQVDRSKWNVRYASKAFFSDLADKFVYDNFGIAFNLKGTKK
ncbi:MAG: YceI family protein [Bacteroidetes bacterium]|nr:MAG: YceI family protein [Bacteroidota bacterium]